MARRSKADAFREWRDANLEHDRAKSREWLKQNPEKAAENQRKWREANPEKVRAYDRARYQRDREKRLAAVKEYGQRTYDPRRARDYHLRRKYGLTIEDYEALLIEQDGRCVLCDAREGDKLVVDHCHESGKVRALLCKHCNTAIGMLRDDPILAERIASYLIGHGRLDMPCVGDDEWLDA